VAVDVAADHEPADDQRPGVDAGAAQRRVQVERVGVQRTRRHRERADDGQRAHRRQPRDQDQRAGPALDHAG
jgi:hypothetical protein